MERPEELIESYLMDKLTASERVDFESAMASDATLKSHTQLQAAVIETIKNARITELKATLNSVKIEPVPIISNPTKIAVALAIIGIALFLYFNTSKKESSLSQPAKVKTESTPREEKLSTDKIDIKKEEIEATAPLSSSIERTNIKRPTKKQQAKVKELARPSIEVVNPSQDFESTTTHELPAITKEREYISLAHIVVENDSSIKDYTFHYKFHKGKLILYGSFDSSLYEILEINGDKKAVFLYYKEKFYILDEKQAKVKMLEPIQDTLLIQRLNEYRLSKK